jgi:hypothetical protein
MSDTPKSESPKFEVIDRRKLKAIEEQEQEPPRSEPPVQPAAPPAPHQPPAGPRLVSEKPARQETPPPPPPAHQSSAPEPNLPPAPTAEESREQKAAYEASAQRAEELLRAQNPGIGAEPPINFEALVQQFYFTALIQLGMGTPEGQPQRVDVRGARNTIDVLGILAEKTRGNLTASEDHLLQSALYEARMAFLEVTGMIGMPAVPPPPAKK